MKLGIVETSIGKLEVISHGDYTIGVDVPYRGEPLTHRGGTYRMCVFFRVSPNDSVIPRNKIDSNLYMSVERYYFGDRTKGVSEATLKVLLGVAQETCQRFIDQNPNALHSAELERLIEIMGNKTEKISELQTEMSNLEDEKRALAEKIKFVQARIQ